MKSSYAKWVLAVVGLSLVAACGTASRMGAGRRVAYEEAEIRPPLLVPEGLDAVPLNPANELPDTSSDDQIVEQREPPSTGLDEKIEETPNVSASDSESASASGSESSSAEIMTETMTETMTIVVTGENQRLNSAHPVHIVWQTVGLALDRLAVPVSDRDRSNGIYFVDCLAASGREIKKKRWWNVLSRGDSPDISVCELSIVQEGDNVSVHLSPSTEGVPTEQETAELLKEFKADLDRV
ncbi:MAG: outer membrane protein assembly factor BamC [Proteobacteria bacterium]|jgi:uncharacterized lipoprotein|nr:outer membrane protein assembly factor BamC [Pseudomonadota bacterium]